MRYIFISNCFNKLLLVSVAHSFQADGAFFLEIAFPIPIGVERQ